MGNSEEWVALGEAIGLDLGLDLGLGCMRGAPASILEASLVTVSGE